MAEAAQIENDRTETELSRIVNEAIRDRGLFVVEMKLRGHTGSHAVDIFVDSEKGASIDELAVVSRELVNSPALEELLSDGFKLTVSTPGLDRPLVDRRQYVRHTGKAFKIRFATDDAKKTVKGVLKSVDANTVTLELNNREEATIPFESIEKASVDLPW